MVVRFSIFRRLAKVSFDMGLLAGIYCLSFYIRYESIFSPAIFNLLIASLPFALFVKLCCLTAFGVPKLTWRYISMQEVRRIILALALASGILMSIRLSSRFELEPIGPYCGALTPSSLLAIDAALSCLGMIGSRALVRLWTEHNECTPPHARKGLQIPTILIGAGRAGSLVAREIAAHPDCGILPVGFLDDDRTQHGIVIQGLRVLGPIDQLAEIVQKYGVQQALITVAHSQGAVIRRILDACKVLGIASKIIPGVSEIVEGKINLIRMRDVAIEDILRREPVRLDSKAIAANIRGRRVLVTGAGGSIGSELCREICHFGPLTLILLEQAEHNLFQIHWHLAEEFPGVRLIPVIGDICDQGRVEQIVAAHRPEIVFHAAAHKHVPMMEWNPGEAVKNNVLGTRAVANIAAKHGVRKFVMISTDKAVNPSSIMGVTKRVAEMYIQALSQQNGTKFVAVRFGNVLGSTGSVIPIFKEQICNGGPVTVTHPEMRRYFMTIPEACQLVLQSSSMGRGGEIFILDMGEPVRIVDLALDLIRLSGLSPEEIEIRYTGIRPGEKLFEEFAHAAENAEKTQHPRVYIGKLTPSPLQWMQEQLDELARLANCGDTEPIIAKLKAIVPEYAPLVPRQDGAQRAIRVDEDGRMRNEEQAPAIARPHRLLTMPKRSLPQPADI